MKINIMISIVLGLLIAGCDLYTTDPSTSITTDPTTDACKISAVDTKTLTPSPIIYDVVMARAVLVGFFDALNAGWYDEAAVQYGGSYEALIDMNPDIDPGNQAALFERACTVNGYQCLKVKQIINQTKVWPDTYTYSITFSNPDGSLFELSACCGQDSTETPPRSLFEITVMLVPQAGNVYRVQTLPVYTP